MHLATKWSLITPFYRWPKGGATRFHLLVCAITYVSDCVRNFCRPNDHHFSVPAINTKHDLRMIVLWFCDTSCCVHRNRQFLKNIIKAVRDLSNAKLRDTNHKKINDSGKSSILYCYDWMSLSIVRATAHSNRSHHCGHHDHSHFSFGAHNHTASKLSCIIFALYMFIHLRSLFRLFLNHNKIYFVISVNIKHTEKNASFSACQPFSAYVLFVRVFCYVLICDEQFLIDLQRSYYSTSIALNKYIEYTITHSIRRQKWPRWT